MSKLKFEIGHFLVILVLLLLNVGGCGGQPLSSKFILKVKKQMSIPKEHVHITFLTPWIVFVGILGFQSITLHCKTLCSSLLQINYKITGAKKNQFRIGNERVNCTPCFRWILPIIITQERRPISRLESWIYRYASAQ